MGGPEAPKETIATPPQLRDVMIVPRAPARNLSGNSTLTVFQQNWLFAQQWLRASPSTRMVVEVPVDGQLADIEAAFTTAIAKARGKEITLCIGHGGAGSFRGLTQTVFDTLPESAHGMIDHRGAMTREVLDFETIAEKQNGKWVPKPSGPAKLTLSQAKIDSLSPRFELLTRLGDKLKAGGVGRLRILSCNIGLDAQFGRDLAKKLGVELRLYRGLVAMAEVAFTSPGKPDDVREQVWIVDDENDPEGNRPPTDDKDHASFHEIPSHRESTFPP